MSDILENLPPVVMLVLALLLVVWLVLLLLVPFMIESIRGSARKTYSELDSVNKKLDRLIELLDERNTALRIEGLRGHDAPEPLVLREQRVEPRVRREPTISG